MAYRETFSLVAFIFTFAFFAHYTQPIPMELAQLHHILSTFAGKGQTTLELFAALSTILGRTEWSRELMTVASTACWPLVGAVAVHRLREHCEGTQGLVWSIATSSWIFLYGVGVAFTRDEGKVLLNEIHDIADACLLVKPGICGIREALILMSMAVGCNMVDGFVAYFLLLVDRAETLWRRIADDKRSLLSLFRHGLVSFATWALLWPSLILLLIGAVTPASEAKAWGHYNLRFFSARARRAMSPFTALDASTSASNSPFALYPELAYTLYVPGAGFLWSDAMMWRQSLPSTSSQDIDADHDGSDLDWIFDESWRVFFQDKYAARYPWVVDIDTGPTPSGRTKLSVGLTDNVRVRDPNASRYLCVIANQSVVSEAGYVESNAEHTGRIRVGFV
ncbi:unnamed protein product [Zymoseptoria tritici ST99CH_3D7]|uniref:Uncharacterized protein n=1 Tax=Zymoseptoria tritici (strain ST99CH_3D7) TaxID=1276538 RepID=A0A1X7RS46_ZYMT9|nr:unnamed protein product [Zymoseptoria tritici ST99CH_3D7]